MNKTSRRALDRPAPPALAEPRVFKVEHATLQERVYQQLRGAFLRSQFLPGETLTIRGLALQTGTSVQPVRDALQRLCAEGALEWLPNTAFRVHPIDVERYRELWEVRALLEGRAAGLAAERITDEDLTALRRINRDMRAAMRQGDASATLDSNRDFHFTVYRASHSVTLVNLIEMIWIQVSPLFATFTRRAMDEPSSSPSTVKLSHLAEEFFRLQDGVIEALGQRDRDAAAEAIRRILSSSAVAFEVVAKEASPAPASSKRSKRTRRARA